MAEIGSKDPKERPSISELQAALKIVPTPGFTSLGLQPTVDAFLKKTHYPTAENLLKLLEALNKVASSLEEEALNVQK